jgi:putative ABC transport system permease protein
VREVGLVANRGVQVSYAGDVVTGVGMQGGTPNTFALTNTQPALGRFFTEAEDSRSREVVVLGWDLKARFFPNADPIGKSVQVDGRPFEVIGVGEPKGMVFPIKPTSRSTATAPACNTISPPSTATIWKRPRMKSAL